jgi:hypothetical protein
MAGQSLPGLEHNVGEFYNTSFDSYQTITGLKTGIYLIYLQGYYRFGGPVENAYATYIEGGENSMRISTATASLLL